MHRQDHGNIHHQAKWYLSLRLYRNTHPQLHSITHDAQLHAHTRKHTSSGKKILMIACAPKKIARVHVRKETKFVWKQDLDNGGRTNNERHITSEAVRADWASIRTTSLPTSPELAVSADSWVSESRYTLIWMAMHNIQEISSRIGSLMPWWSICFICIPFSRTINADWPCLTPSEVPIKDLQSVDQRIVFEEWYIVVFERGYIFVCPGLISSWSTGQSSKVRRRTRRLSICQSFIKIPSLN